MNYLPQIALTSAMALAGLSGCKDKAGDDRPVSAPAQAHGISTPKPKLEMFHGTSARSGLLAVGSSHVIWAERSGGVYSIMAKSLNGGDAIQLTDAPLSQVRSLHASGSDVYFCAGGPEPALFHATQAAKSAKKIASVCGRIATDASYVYVLHRGHRDLPGTLSRVPRAGGNTTALYTAKSALGRASLVVSDRVYILADKREKRGNVGVRLGYVTAISADGTATPIAKDIPAPGIAIGARGNELWMTARPDRKRTLMRVNVADGKVSPAFGEQWEIWRFAIAGDTVFAIAHSDKWQLIALDTSGKATPLADFKRPIPTPVRMSEKHVYWLENRGIMRVPRPKPQNAGTETEQPSSPHPAR